MKALLLFVFVALSIQGFSQQKLPYHTPLRDADYPKLVTRAVTITGDKNPLLQVPALETSITNTLLNGIKTGVIKAYSADNDSLFLSLQDLAELLESDSYSGSAPFAPDSVTKLIIKEEWDFQWDKGRLVVHIKGIAPVIKVIDTAGITHEKPVCWLHYSDIREFLATQNIKSNLQKEKLHNLRDVFDGRYFSSEIISESKL